MADTAAVDMFVVVTTKFRLLYAAIILDHDRRPVVHFDVTQNPPQVLHGARSALFVRETLQRPATYLVALDIEHAVHGSVN